VVCHSCIPLDSSHSFWHTGSTNIYVSPYLYIPSLTKPYIVLRMYKKPPRYDMALASKARVILKYSLFLHFAFGFYMFSNSSIFTLQGDYTILNYINSLSNDASNSVSSYYSSNSYISISRLTQTQSFLYLLGFALFILLFILNELIGAICSNCW
jgi:hypothetical protein